jgi:hypothetical protein
MTVRVGKIPLAWWFDPDVMSQDIGNSSWAWTCVPVWTVLGFEIADSSAFVRAVGVVLMFYTNLSVC